MATPISDPLALLKIPSAYTPITGTTKGFPVLVCFAVITGPFQATSGPGYNEHWKHQDTTPRPGYHIFKDDQGRVFEIPPPCYNTFWLSDNVTTIKGLVNKLNEWIPGPVRTLGLDMTLSFSKWPYGRRHEDGIQALHYITPQNVNSCLWMLKKQPLHCGLKVILGSKAQLLALGPDSFHALAASKSSLNNRRPAQDEDDGNGHGDVDNFGQQQRRESQSEPSRGSVSNHPILGHSLLSGRSQLGDHTYLSIPTHYEAPGFPPSDRPSDFRAIDQPQQVLPRSTTPVSAHVNSFSALDLQAPGFNQPLSFRQMNRTRSSAYGPNTFTFDITPMDMDSQYMFLHTPIDARDVPQVQNSLASGGIRGSGLDQARAGSLTSEVGDGSRGEISLEHQHQLDSLSHDLGSEVLDPEEN